MCKCTPTKRTPFCGKPGCEWPAMPYQQAAMGGFDWRLRRRRSFRSGYSDGRLASDGRLTGLGERGIIVTKYVLGFDDKEFKR